MSRLDIMYEEHTTPGRKIGTFEAKKNLSRLLAAVKQGKVFTITSRGRPVAQLVPYREGRNTSMEALLAEFKRIRSAVTASDNVKGYIKKGRT